MLKDHGRIVGAKVKQAGETFEKSGIGDDRRGRLRIPGRPLGGNPDQYALRDMDSCLQYRMTNVDCDFRYCDFYLGKVAPGGYVWIFPKDDGLANVGIGVQLSQIEFTGGRQDLSGPMDRPSPGLREGQEDRRSRWRGIDLGSAQTNGRQRRRRRQAMPRA